jgi:hypothetical protein
MRETFVDPALQTISHSSLVVGEVFEGLEELDAMAVIRRHCEFESNHRLNFSLVDRSLLHDPCQRSPFGRD